MGDLVVILNEESPQNVYLNSQNCTPTGTQIPCMISAPKDKFIKEEKVNSGRVFFLVFPPTFLHRRNVKRRAQQASDSIKIQVWEY